MQRCSPSLAMSMTLLLLAETNLRPNLVSPFFPFTGSNITSKVFSPSNLNSFLKHF